MKIGITGATGQLGRLVIEKLKGKTSAGNITALVRTPEKAADLGVETRRFDYTKPGEMIESLKGIDTLLLISGNELGQRAKQHTNVIDSAKKAGVKYIVYTSILHADSSGLSLAVEHLATEKELKGSGIQFTILRNGWYTENYTNSVKTAVTNGALIGSAGNGKISSATRADFAEVAALVLTGNGHTGKIYELAGDHAYTLSDLAEEISRQCGSKIPYNNLPESEYANILQNAGVPEMYANAIAGWDFCVSKNDLFDDSHTLSKLIGRPTTSLPEAVKAGLA